MFFRNCFCFKVLMYKPSRNPFNFHRQEKYTAAGTPWPRCGHWLCSLRPGENNKYSRLSPVSPHVFFVFLIPRSKENLKLKFFNSFCCFTNTKDYHQAFSCKYSAFKAPSSRLREASQVNLELIKISQLWVTEIARDIRKKLK